MTSGDFHTRINLRRLWVSAILLTLALPACLPQMATKKLETAEEIDLVEKFAKALAQTSISRRSGSATLMRLEQLFPNAKGQAVLKPDDFHSAKATEINRALGAIDRPVNAVAIMALRSKASTLCKTYVGGTSDTSSIFNLEGKSGLAPALLLGIGETAPADEATYNALSAARRVWLSLASATSPEVTELARLYRAVLTLTDDPREAKRALCEAAILAPQFWMGVSGGEDAAIRVAVEIGNRIPTHQELYDIKKGTLTLRKFTSDLQNEPGYYRAVRSWHEEWLGLRPFMATNSDFRVNTHEYGEPDMGTSRMSGVAFTFDAALDHLKPARQAHHTGETCTPDLQPFDPRTGFTYWEHDRAVPDGSWIVGAWVAPGMLNTYVDHVITKYADQGFLTDTPGSDSYLQARQIVADSCAPQSAVKDYDDKTWYLCTGLVPLSADEYTDVSNLASGMLQEVLKWQQLAIVQRLTSPDDRIRSYANNLVGAAESPSWTPYQGYLGPIRKGYEDFLTQRIASWGSQRFYKPDLTGLRRLVGSGNADAPWTYERGSIVRVNDFDWQIRGIGVNPKGNYVWLYRDRTNALSGPTSGATNLNQFSGGGYASTGALGNYYLKLPDLDRFTLGMRRARRFTPDGNEQNGRSIVNLWYSGAQATVCNAASRYFASCAYRPPAGVNVISDLQNWNAADPRVVHLSLFGWSNNGGFSPHSAMYMQCGPMNLSAIASGAYDSTRKVFDEGYSKGGPGDLNALAFAPFYTGINFNGNGGPSYQAEMAAMKRIHTDITEEPYYLMEHIIKTNGDYREMLTAEYSCGSSDLANLYRSQGYYMQARPDDLFGGPPSITGSCAATSPDGRPLSKFQLTGNDRIPIQLLRSSYNRWPNDFIVYKQMLDQGETEMGTKPVSGILGMPAMLTPVAPNMRTIASRLFLRVLCGDPSMYKQNFTNNPLDDEDLDDIHECDNEMCDYIPQAQKDNHLSVPCLQCHINMDPLASALSFNFLEHIGDYYKEHQGEMIGYGPAALNHPGTNLAYGIRGGGPKGEGFFTRIPMNGSKPVVPVVTRVSGVNEVAREISESRDFARCVVNKTFLNVFGRQPSFTDAEFVDNRVNEFGRKGFNYNELVRDLVDSDTFRRRN